MLICQFKYCHSAVINNSTFVKLRYLYRLFQEIKLDLYLLITFCIGCGSLVYFE